MAGEDGAIERFHRGDLIADEDHAAEVVEQEGGKLGAVAVVRRALIRVDAPGDGVADRHHTQRALLAGAGQIPAGLHQIHIVRKKIQLGGVGAAAVGIGYQSVAVEQDLIAALAVVQTDDIGAAFVHQGGLVAREVDELIADLEGENVLAAGGGDGDFIGVAHHQGAAGVGVHEVVGAVEIFAEDHIAQIGIGEVGSRFQAGRRIAGAGGADEFRSLQLKNIGAPIGVAAKVKLPNGGIAVDGVDRSNAGGGHVELNGGREFHDQLAAALRNSRHGLRGDGHGSIKPVPPAGPLIALGNRQAVQRGDIVHQAVEVGALISVDLFHTQAQMAARILTGSNLFGQGVEVHAGHAVPNGRIVGRRPVEGPLIPVFLIVVFALKNVLIVEEAEELAGLRAAGQKAFRNALGEGDLRHIGADGFNRFDGDAILVQNGFTAVADSARTGRVGDHIVFHVAGFPQAFHTSVARNDIENRPAVDFAHEGHKGNLHARMQTLHIIAHSGKGLDPGRIALMAGHIDRADQLIILRISEVGYRPIGRGGIHQSLAGFGVDRIDAAVVAGVVADRSGEGEDNLIVSAELSFQKAKAGVRIGDHAGRGVVPLNDPVRLEKLAGRAGSVGFDIAGLIAVFHTEDQLGAGVGFQNRLDGVLIGGCALGRIVRLQTAHTVVHAAVKVGPEAPGHALKQRPVFLQNAQPPGRAGLIDHAAGEFDGKLIVADPVDRLNGKLGVGAIDGDIAIVPGATVVFGGFQEVAVFILQHSNDRTVGTDVAFLNAHGKRASLVLAAGLHRHQDHSEAPGAGDGPVIGIAVILAVDRFGSHALAGFHDRQRAAVLAVVVLRRSDIARRRTLQILRLHIADDAKQRAARSPIIPNGLGKTDAHDIVADKLGAHGFGIFRRGCAGARQDHHSRKADDHAGSQQQGHQLLAYLHKHFLLCVPLMGTIQNILSHCEQRKSRLFQCNLIFCASCRRALAKLRQGMLYWGQTI